MGKLDKFIKGGKRKKSYSVDSDGSPASPSSPRTRDGQFPFRTFRSHFSRVGTSSETRPNCDSACVSDKCQIIPTILVPVSSQNNALSSFSRLQFTLQILNTDSELTTDTYDSYWYSYVQHLQQRNVAQVHRNLETPDMMLEPHRHFVWQTKQKPVFLQVSAWHFACYEF